MIREFKADDMDVVIDIWLKASVKSHDFVAPGFWKSQVENMRNIYIPASETFVLENDGVIVGFYSLHENTLAAIFISPDLQGQGFGSQLLAHAKKQRSELTLSVYKENKKSIQFYLSNGFSIINEQDDEHTGHRECIMSTC